MKTHLQSLLTLLVTTIITIHIRSPYFRLRLPLHNIITTIQHPTNNLNLLVQRPLPFPLLVLLRLEIPPISTIPLHLGLIGPHLAVHLGPQMLFPARRAMDDYRWWELLFIC